MVEQVGDGLAKAYRGSDVAVAGYGRTPLRKGKRITL